jgi:hypothetical protein
VASSRAQPAAAPSSDASRPRAATPRPARTLLVRAAMSDAAEGAALTTAAGTTGAAAAAVVGGGGGAAAVVTGAATAAGSRGGRLFGLDGGRLGGSRNWFGDKSNRQRRAGQDLERERLRGPHRRRTERQQRRLAFTRDQLEQRALYGRMLVAGGGRERSVRRNRRRKWRFGTDDGVALLTPHHRQKGEGGKDVAPRFQIGPRRSLTSHNVGGRVGRRSVREPYRSKSM